MQFSAYARAYRCCTRASSTPDAGPPPREPRQRLGWPFFEVVGFRGRVAARLVEARHPRNPARISVTPKPMAMQAATSWKKVAIGAEIRRTPPLPLSLRRCADGPARQQAK